MLIIIVEVLIATFIMLGHLSVPLEILRVRFVYGFKPLLVLFVSSFVKNIHGVVLVKVYRCR